MSTKVAMERLDVSVARGQQDVTFTELLEREGEKFRIKIRSNAYKSQSSAVLEIWSPGARQWNELVRLDPMEMSTPEGLCYSRELRSEGEFLVDRGTLIRRALLVVE